MNKREDKNINPSPKGKIQRSARDKMDTVIEKFIQGLEDINLKREIEKIYLFGSRATGAERPDSDYDLLIVTSSPNKKFRDKIYDIVVDILLEMQRVVSLKIFKTEEFKRLCRMQTPFMQNVLREGIRII